MGKTVASKVTLFVLYRAWKAAEAAWKAAQAEAIGDRPHGDKVASDADGIATVVRGETRVADVVKAREILSRPKFSSVTEVKVSLPLLDAAVKAGRVTQAEYDTIVKATSKAPYLKITLH